MTRLAAPWSLALLALLVPIFLIWWRAGRRPAAVRHADLSLMGGAPSGWRARLRHLPRVLRVLFLVLAAAALARPQAGVRQEEITSHGVDIVVAVDRSGSMRALDLSPDRLSVAKTTIATFAEGRPSDRLGLVAFAREAYTACPLTLDHGALAAILEEVDFAQRDEDGTAIGLGLAAAVNRLKASDAKSRVAVLVTDGVNNAGSIAPLTAADLARQQRIRTYTIGIGTHGYARVPVATPDGRQRVVPMPVELDEKTLQEIATMTGGRYFRADATGDLREIFETIDELEKTEITSTVHVAWSDRFEPLLLLAALVLALDVSLARWLLGGLP